MVAAEGKTEELVEGAEGPHALDVLQREPVGYPRRGTQLNEPPQPSARLID